MNGIKRLRKSKKQKARKKEIRIYREERSKSNIINNKNYITGTGFVVRLEVDGDLLDDAVVADGEQRLVVEPLAELEAAVV